MKQQSRRSWTATAWAVIALVLLVLVAGCGPATPETAAPEPQIVLEDCRIVAPGLAMNEPAQCGSLTRPENPDDRFGPAIALRVAVIPAISRNRADDALFLLAGGPGQAASEAFVPLIDSLAGVNQQRDIVLVDQRGTGSSAPLDCPIDDPLLDQVTSPADPRFQQWIAGCLERLDAVPQYYTTTAAMHDLDAVRAALGYEQINLLGVSYGTRAALTYLKLYPERVRTLVLDGIVPQDEALGSDTAGDAQRALDAVFAACAADAACAAAFPDLPETFAALLDRLEAEPIAVQLDDPFTGAPTDVELTREAVVVTIHNLSYSPETAALLPLLIHTAQVSGDLRPLAAQTLMVTRQVVDTISLGMRYAVVCSEDVPFYPDAPATTDAYLGNEMTVMLSGACPYWPHEPVAADFKQPPRSDVPALLLSGERDPVTPPENGEQVAADLPNSRHIVAPGQGHNIFYRGCLPNLVAEFVARADWRDLDAGCVDQLEAPPYFLDFTGPGA
jgi:pimeloyl-ACP methyl ester carboxylesterase